ncbi:DegT/DnrJ/EryC1/StrS family aminotransferase [Xenorhabdus griffiniae]|uniref:DegT/DnrJ/EryC1/StrS family aminotransferase n=1 Tax=Xenorhabdus griffiniae TaxID=351672 RepID=UPI0023584747|nr:DegT/DnrJ/EryC1/StrS family aminotransferase [Xenorhabdus griffiniae]MDC9606282.1 DegT/DnrJ/EryC1/StrS family aminotransferase [Xenorhabdus griffiniae]
MTSFAERASPYSEALRSSSFRKLLIGQGLSMIGDAVCLAALPVADIGAGKQGNAYYHYVVRSRKRDKLQQHLAKHDIEAAIHYPIPIHRQQAWLRSQPQIVLPVTERLAQEILTIPCHHHLSDNDVEKIVMAIKQFDLIKV